MADTGETSDLYSELYDDLFDIGCQSEATENETQESMEVEEAGSQLATEGESVDTDGHHGDDEATCDDLDLYDDILTEEDCRDKKSYDEMVTKFEVAMETISRLQMENQQLVSSVKKFRSSSDNAQMNISSILLTARAEVNRKTQEINQLRKQLSKPSVRDRRRFGTLNTSSAASELDTPQKHRMEESNRQDKTSPERSFHSQKEHDKYVKTEREGGGMSSHKKSYKEMSDRDRKRLETDKFSHKGKNEASTSDKLPNDERYGSSRKGHDSDSKHCHRKRDRRKSKERETMKSSEKEYMFEKTSQDVLADRSDESEISGKVKQGKPNHGRPKCVDEDSDGADETRQHSLSQTCFTRRQIEKLRLLKEKKSMDREKELSDSIESPVTKNDEKLENKTGRDKHKCSSSTEKHSDNKSKSSATESETKVESSNQKKNTDKNRSEKNSDQVPDKAKSEKKSDAIRSEKKCDKLDNKHRPEKKSEKVTDKARSEKKIDRTDDKTRSEKKNDKMDDKTRSEKNSDKMDDKTRSEKKSERMDDKTRSEKKSERMDDKTRSEKKSDKMDDKTRSEKKSERMDDKTRSERKSDKMDDKTRSEKKSERMDDKTRSEKKSDKMDDRTRSEKKSDKMNDRTRSEKKSERMDDKTDKTRSEKRRDKTDDEASGDVKGQPKRFDLRQLLKSKQGKSEAKKSQREDSEVAIKDPCDGKSEQKSAATPERVKKVSSQRKLLKVDYYLESDKAFLAQLLKSAKDDKRSSDDGAKTFKQVETSEKKDLKIECTENTEPPRATRDVINYSDVDNTISVTDLSSKEDEHIQESREVESRKETINKPLPMDTGMSEKDSVVSSVNKQPSDIVSCSERNTLSDRKADVNDGVLASEKLSKVKLNSKKIHHDKDYNEDTFKELEVSIPDNNKVDDKDTAVGQFEVEESLTVPQNENHEADSAADINSGELDKVDTTDIGVRRSARIKSQETKTSNSDVSCTEKTVAQVHEKEVKEDGKKVQTLKSDSSTSKNITKDEEVAVCKSNKQNSELIVSPKQNKTSRRKSSEKHGQPFRGVFSETISSVTSSDVTHTEADIDTTVLTETTKVEAQKLSPNKFCGKLNCNMKVNHLHPKVPKFTSPLKGKNLSTSPNHENDVNNSDRGGVSNEINGENETPAVEGTDDVNIPDVTSNHDAAKPTEIESRPQRDTLLEDLSMNSGSSGSFGSNILTERTKSPDSSSDSSGSSSDSSGSEYSDSEYETAHSMAEENQSDDEDVKSSLSGSGDDSVQSVKAGKGQILEAVVSSLKSNSPGAAPVKKDESENALLKLKEKDSHEVQEVNNRAEITEHKTLSESEETNTIAKDKPKSVNSQEKHADKTLVDDNGMSVVNSGNDSKASKDKTTKSNKHISSVRTTEQTHEAVKTTPEKRRPCANEVPSVLTESPDKSFLLQSLLCGVESVIESKQFDVREKAEVNVAGESGSKTDNNATENKEIKVDNPRERELLEADLFGEPLSSDSSCSDSDSDTDSTSDGSSSSSCTTCSCSDCGSGSSSSSSSSGSSSSGSSSDTSTSETETSSSDEQDPKENIGQTSVDYEKQPGMIPDTSVEPKSVVDPVEKNIDECKEPKCETESAENKSPRTETESKCDLTAKQISPCVLKISRQQTDANHEDDLSKCEEMVNLRAIGDIQVDQNSAFSVVQRQPNHIKESTQDDHFKTKDNKKENDKENVKTHEINRNVDKDCCEELIDNSYGLKQIPPVNKSQNRIEKESELNVRMANLPLPMQHVGMHDQLKRKCSREREDAELMADIKAKSNISTKSDTEVVKQAFGEKECDQGDKQMDPFAVKNIENDVRDSDRCDNSEKQVEEKVRMSRTQKENDSSNTLTRQVADMASLSAQSKNHDYKNKGTVDSSHSTSELKKCFNVKKSEKQRSELEDMNSLERKSDSRSENSNKQKDNKNHSKNKIDHSGTSKNEVVLKKPRVDNKIPEKQQKVTDAASKVVKDSDKLKNSEKIFEEKAKKSNTQKESRNSCIPTRKGSDVASLSAQRKNPDSKIKNVDSSHPSSDLKRCLDSKTSKNLGSESEEMKSLERIISHLRSKSGNRQSAEQKDNQTSKTISKTETEQTDKGKNEAVQKKAKADKKVPENQKKITDVALNFFRESDKYNSEKKVEDKAKKSSTQKESHNSCPTRKCADVASLSAQSKKQDSKIKNSDSSHSSSDLKKCLDRKSEKQRISEDVSLKSKSHLRSKNGNRKSDEEKDNFTSKTIAKSKTEQSDTKKNAALQKKLKVDNKVPENQQKVKDVASNSTRLSDSKSFKETMSICKEKLNVNNKVTCDKEALATLNAKGLRISPEMTLREVTSFNLDSYKIPKRKPVCKQHTSKRKQIEKESREAKDNKKRSYDRHRKESSVSNKVNIPDKNLDKRTSKQTAPDKLRPKASSKAKSKSALSKEFLSSSDSEDEGLVSSDSEETSDNSDRLVEAIFGKNVSSTESQKSMKYSDICRTRSSEDTDDIVKDIAEETGHDRKTTVTRKRVRKISSDTESENGAKQGKCRDKEPNKSDTQNVETVTKGDDLVSPRTHVVQQASRLVSELIESKSNKRNPKTSKAQEAKKINGIKDGDSYQKGKEVERKSHTIDCSDSSHTEKSHTSHLDKNDRERRQDSDLGEKRKTKPERLESDSQTTKEQKRSEKTNVANFNSDVGKEVNEKESEVVTKDDVDIKKGKKLESVYSIFKETKSLRVKSLVENNERIEATDVLTLDIHDEETLDFLDCSEEKDTDSDSDSDCESESDSSGSSGSSEEGEISDESDTDQIKVIRSPAKPYKLFQENPASPKKLTLNTSFNTKLKIGTKFSPIKFPPSPAEGKNISKRLDMDSPDQHTPRRKPEYKRKYASDSASDTEMNSSRNHPRSVRKSARKYDSPTMRRRSVSSERKPRHRMRSRSPKRFPRNRSRSKSPRSRHKSGSLSPKYRKNERTDRRKSGYNKDNRPTPPRRQRSSSRDSGIERRRLRFTARNSHRKDRFNSSICSGSHSDRDRHNKSSRHDANNRLKSPQESSDDSDKETRSRFRESGHRGRDSCKKRRGKSESECSDKDNNKSEKHDSRKSKKILDRRDSESERTVNKSPSRVTRKERDDGGGSKKVERDHSVSDSEQLGTKKRKRRHFRSSTDYETDSDESFVENESSPVLKKSRKDV